MSLNNKRSINNTSDNSKVSYKRYKYSDFIVSDEIILKRLKKTMDDIIIQYSKLNSNEKLVNNSNKYVIYYSNLLINKFELLNDSVCEIEIKIKNSRPKRIKNKIIYYKDEIFIPGSNNQHTLGRKIDRYE
jgi:hypothetical protein